MVGVGAGRQRLGGSSTVPTMDPFNLVDTTIDRKYRVDELVGEGGFGLVYRAFHLSFGQPIAVKCLKVPPHFTIEAKKLFLDKFREEGKHLARLRHDSIVRVFDFGITPDSQIPYLVLEWLTGEDLEQHLARRSQPYSEQEALRFLRPAVDAIALAHRRGIAHRDMKPANIFLAATEDGIKLRVLDFGIAKAMQEGETATQLKTKTSSGFSAFSPQYGAPEQYRSKKYGPTGPWTDVHALGLILSELVSGQHAFEGEEHADFLLAAIDDSRPTPRHLGVEVSDGFEQLCAKALVRTSKDRFRNADEMLKVMDAILAPATSPTRGATVPAGPAVVASAPSASADTANSAAEPGLQLADNREPEPAKALPGTVAQSPHPRSDPASSPPRGDRTAVASAATKREALLASKGEARGSQADTPAKLSVDGLGKAAVLLLLKISSGSRRVKIAKLLVLLALLLGGGMKLLDVEKEELVAPVEVAPVEEAEKRSTCALRTDNTITCWGENKDGETDAPTGTFSALSAGGGSFRRICALRTDNTIACWGYILDDPPKGTFSAVSVGYEHNCALRTDNTIKCWGGNMYDETNAPKGTFAAVSAGNGHTCALRTDNTITCWGNGDHGETDAPTGTFSAVSARANHTCALRTDNRIECWGENKHGQTDAPAGTFSAVSVGFGHNCALRTNNKIKCWGFNSDGQTDPPTGTFSAVSAGWLQNWALGFDNTITCWGENVDCQTDAPTGTFLAPPQ